MSEVSDGRLIRVGLVGPKPRPEGVGDGQQVNIPVPPRSSDGGTQEGRSASYWIEVLSL
jgi:hypothetical protein